MARLILAALAAIALCAAAGEARADTSELKNPFAGTAQPAAVRALPATTLKNPFRAEATAAAIRRLPTPQLKNPFAARARPDALPPAKLENPFARQR